MYLLLLACYSGGSVKHGEPEAPDGDEVVGGFHAGGDKDSDTATDSGDTGTAPDSGDTGDTGDTVVTPTEVCYLGPSRDHKVCFPTVPYDAALFGSDYEYPAPYQGSAQYLAPVRFLDLDELTGDEDLAPNFIASEFMESWKGQWAVLQTGFVDHMQELRDYVGGPITVTSGYRNPAYNASVGGVSSSRHTYGDAADLDASGWTVEELGVACEDKGADYVGLYEDGHTHCDWRNDKLDPAFYDPAPAQPVASPIRATLVYGPEGWTAPAQGFDEGEPFRRWQAFDEEGRMIYTGTGRSFHPPAEAASLEVRIGGQQTLRQEL